MAISDALLNFVAPGSPLSLVGGAGANFASQIIDELGVGPGQAPPNIIGVPNTVFGSDMGIDWVKPRVIITIGTALATNNAATLNIQFQGSVDSGPNGNPAYSPNAWTTYMESGPIAAANLAAGAQFRMDFPPAFPFNVLPRFYRINFLPLATATFTAGSIASAMVNLSGDDYKAAYAAKNFVVA